MRQLKNPVIKRGIARMGRTGFFRHVSGFSLRMNQAHKFRQASL